MDEIPTLSIKYKKEYAQMSQNQKIIEPKITIGVTAHNFTE